MAALGAYLQVLRERQGMTREIVAKAGKVTVTSLYRIERGDQTPSIDVVARIVQHLRADWSDVEFLLSEAATEDDARALAYRQFARLLDELPDDERDMLSRAQAQDAAERRALARRLRRMAEDLD